MNLGKFSVSQGVLLNLIMILLAVGGIISFMDMSRDLFPDVSTESISITTILPGASPKEVEELLTTPIEEEVANVDQIDEMISTSSEGVSNIFLTFEPGTKNFFEKVTEVQNEVDRVQDLPTDAEEPLVREIKVSFDLITVCLVGNAPEREVKEFAERLEDQVKIIPGVQEVSMQGIREREIWVEADPLKLRNYNLSLTAVTEAIRVRNLNLPAGYIRAGGNEFTVRTEAEFKNVDDLLETILKEDPDHGLVHLRDVATAKETFEERQTLSRLNGHPTINLLIRKDKHSNAIELAEKVRELVDEMRPSAPSGIEIELIEDRSQEIGHQLQSLYSNLLSGAVLVVFLLTISVGWRAAILVSSGSVLAFLATFIFMHMAGYTINMLSLFALILVLGIFDDDSIVVCENVYRYYEAGMPLKKAVMIGVNEIFWPVTCSALATMSAFMPLLMMGGVLGKFMSVIPVVVTLALIASLLECLFILPAHIYEMGAPPEQALKARHKGPPRWVQGMTSAYRWFLPLAHKMRYGVILLAMLAASGALYVAIFRMDFILFGGRDLQAFALVLEAAPGASLEETTRILQELEDKAVNELVPVTPEVEYVKTNVGSAEIGPGPPRTTGTNSGSINIKLTPLYTRDRFGQVIREEFRTMVQDATGYRTMSFEDRSNGPPVGKAVQIRVRGEDFDELRVVAEEVKAHLATMPGVNDILDNFPPGKDEIRPKIDLSKAAMLGLDVRTIANEVRGAFDGLIASTVHDGDEDVDIRVKFNEEARKGIDALEQIEFATPKGMIPFSSIAKAERVRGFSHISHFNAQRTINVLASVDEKVTNSREVNEALMKEFGSVSKTHPGVTMTFGGEFEDIQESLNAFVKAFLVAIILIYTILGGVFKSFVQPLIILCTVPLGFIGVVAGFYIMNEPLGMFAIIGIIALTGIVVNNAIMLIDFINDRRRQGVSARDAVIEAGVARMRPVLLTSITTVTGLLPMSLNFYGVDPLMKPMALSISWGLTFATILTLVVIPCVYAIFDDWAVWISGKPLGISREEWNEVQTRIANGEVAGNFARREDDDD